MAATSRCGSTSTSVVTSSPIASRYWRVERRLDTSFFIDLLRAGDTAPPPPMPSRAGRVPGAGVHRNESDVGSPPSNQRARNFQGGRHEHVRRHLDVSELHQ